MTEQTIAIYYFIGDFFLAVDRKEQGHCKLSDAGFLTKALLVARYFYGSLHPVVVLCAAPPQGARMIDKSGLIRRLHRLQEQLVAFFLALAGTRKGLACCQPLYQQA